MPVALRLTTVGAYHVQKWAPSFAYLDGMLFDTPIFDVTTMEVLARQPNSFGIAIRYERAEAFRAYLKDVWDTQQLPHTTLTRRTFFLLVSRSSMRFTAL